MQRSPLVGSYFSMYDRSVFKRGIASTKLPSWQIVANIWISNSFIFNDPDILIFLTVQKLHPNLWQLDRLLVSQSETQN